MRYLVIVFLLLQGCIAVPFINAYKEAGFTAEDRKAKLPKQVRLFGNNLGMSSSMQMAQFIAPDKRREVMTKLDQPDRKIVDVKVNFVDFNEDGTDASVDLAVRGYQVPFYIVKTTVEHTKWKYDGDWLLYEIDSD